MSARTEAILEEIATLQKEIEKCSVTGAPPPLALVEKIGQLTSELSSAQVLVKEGKNILND